MPFGFLGSIAALLLIAAAVPAAYVYVWPANVLRPIVGAVRRAASAAKRQPAAACPRRATCYTISSSSPLTARLVENTLTLEATKIRTQKTIGTLNSKNVH